jgi:hypothetical protein
MSLHLHHVPQADMLEYRLKILQIIPHPNKTCTFEYAALIQLKHIYNFLCSMLVLHHFLHVLFTLRGVFMQFLELTY